MCCQNAAKTKLNLYADDSFFPVLIFFPPRTVCDSQHSIMVQRGVAFKEQIDVSDIIVSLHKTVGRGAEEEASLAGLGAN